MCNKCERDTMNTAEADRILDEGFAQFHARLASLRITPSEFVKNHTDMSYHTYWRSRSSEMSLCPAFPARSKTLGKLEDALDAYEANQKEKRRDRPVQLP